MRNGPVLEVTTSFQQFKYGIEIRIKSVKQDDSHSWVRISYGTVKYVIDAIEDNAEIPADPQEEQMPQTSIKLVVAKFKSKSKTTTESTRWYNSNHTDARLDRMQLSFKEHFQLIVFQKVVRLEKSYM